MVTSSVDGGFWCSNGVNDEWIIQTNLSSSDLQERLGTLINDDLSQTGEIIKVASPTRIFGRLQNLDLINILNLDLGRARSVDLNRPFWKHFEEGDFFNTLRMLFDSVDHSLLFLPSAKILHERVDMLNVLRSKAITIIGDVSGLNTFQPIFSLATERRIVDPDRRKVAQLFLRYYSLHSTLYRGWLADDYEETIRLITQEKGRTIRHKTYSEQLAILISNFETSFDLYAYIVIQYERSKGNFPTWEGIYIVREWAE